MVSAKELLRTYHTRIGMQERGVTNPPEAVKEFCLLLVRELQTLPPQAEVEYVNRGSDGYDFVAEGLVLATLPQHENLNDYT